MIDKKIKDDNNKRHAKNIMISNEVFTITNFYHDTNYVEGSDIKATNNRLYYYVGMTVNDKIRIRSEYELDKKDDYNFKGATIDLIIKKKYRDKNNKVRKTEKTHNITYEFVDYREDYNDKLCLKFSPNALIILNKLKRQLQIKDY